MPTTLIQNANDIRLNHQNEVDQILGHPPKWILRWGISLVFIATMLFGVLAWLIKYPDIIPTKVQILTENPAIRLVPMVSGKLEDLLVENQEVVEEGQLLAILESPVNYKDVLILDTFLKKVEVIQKPKTYLQTRPSISLKLGNMQNLYAALVQKIKDYQHHIRQTSFYSKLWTLEDQIDHILALNRSLKKQQHTLAKEVALVKKNLQRNQKLYQEDVISSVDLERVEMTYLQYQRQLDNSETQIINNKVQIEQLQSQIVDLRQSRADEQSMKELSIKENIQNLQSQIAIWKQNYQIKAPIKGKINLTKIWSSNQFVNAGEELLTIVPLKSSGKVIAKAQLPIDNSGKVMIGQQANIMLNGYPYQEYGIIRSEILQINLVPDFSTLPQEGKYYMIELFIPDSLKTTYGKVIPFSQEMEGTANIITEDRRILQRIFDRVWSILKNT